MRFRFFLRNLFSFLILTNSTWAQSPSNLPPCLQTCINENSSNCAEADVACICRLSSSTFLTSVVNCYATTCTPTIAINLVLSALEPLCVLASVPIPSAALASAESAANSAVSVANSVANSAVAAASSVVASVIGGGGVTTSDGGLVGVSPTTSIPGGLVTTTILAVETDSAGVTLTIGVLEVYGPSTTVLGTPVVVTESASVTAARPTAVPLGGTASVSSGQQTASTTVEAQSSSGAAVSATGATSQPSSSTPSGTTSTGVTSTGPNGSLLTSQSGGWRFGVNSGLICLGVMAAGMVLGY